MTEEVQIELIDAMKLKIYIPLSSTGTFPLNPPIKRPLLRVVQVDLDIPQLLGCMRQQAARVITSIVEMTNAAHSYPLTKFPLPTSSPAAKMAKRLIEDDETTTPKRQKL